MLALDWISQIKRGTRLSETARLIIWRQVVCSSSVVAWQPVFVVAMPSIEITVGKQRVLKLVSDCFISNVCSNSSQSHDTGRDEAFTAHNIYAQVGKTQTCIWYRVWPDSLSNRWPLSCMKYIHYHTYISWITWCNWTFRVSSFFEHHSAHVYRVWQNIPRIYSAIMFVCVVKTTWLTHE